MLQKMVSSGNSPKAHGAGLQLGIKDQLVLPGQLSVSLISVMEMAFTVLL